MLLAEIKYDDCGDWEGWTDWMEFGDCITIRQALLIPLAVPVGAVSRIRLVEPDEAQFRKMRRRDGCAGNEDCINCKGCTDCFGCSGCEDCDTCSSCLGCSNCLSCINCHNCVGCVGLVNASGIVN